MAREERVRECVSFVASAAGLIFSRDFQFEIIERIVLIRWHRSRSSSTWISAVPNAVRSTVAGNYGIEDRKHGSKDIYDAHTLSFDTELSRISAGVSLTAREQDPGVGPAGARSNMVASLGATDQTWIRP